VLKIGEFNSQNPLELGYSRLVKLESLTNFSGFLTMLCPKCFELKVRPPTNDNNIIVTLGFLVNALAFLAYSVESCNTSHHIPLIIEITVYLNSIEDSARS
jgi:hypothetical protein